MGAKKEPKTSGISFGKWLLRPAGGDNWELMESKPGTKHGWSTHNRFYQYNTLVNAFRYAANQELRRGCTEEVISINEALKEYERITNKLITDFKAAQSAVQPTE